MLVDGRLFFVLAYCSLYSLLKDALDRAEEVYSCVVDDCREYRYLCSLVLCLSDPELEVVEVRAVKIDSSLMRNGDLRTET